MKKILKILLSAFFIASIICSPAYSAELPLVMNVYIEEDSINVYYKNIDSEVENVYIGNEECISYAVDDIGEINTIIIVDNSSSINEHYREGIKEFMTELVAARNDGDIFTVATFSKEITYLVQESSDYLDIKNKIDSINFVNQESYFTNTLYNILDELSKSEEKRYTRVIIIADGIDNENLGYTNDELYDKIESVKVPIYTIGCMGNNNEENLKNMFSLSRMSNAKDYLIDETSFTDILLDILNDTNISKLTLTPQDDLCDGTNKTIRISFGEDFCLVDAAMPFKVSEKEIDSKSIDTSVEANSNEILEVEQTDESQSSISLILIAAIIMLLAAVIILIIKISKSRSKLKNHEEVDISHIGNPKDSTVVSEEAHRQTELLDMDEMKYNKTDILSGRKSVRLCLQDLNDSAKTFEYPIRDRVLIGKDPARCQIVIDYSKYVSAVHCEIIAREKDFVVRDGGDNVIASTNGTYVNDKKAVPELPLPEGSILRIGNISFRVNYK